MRRGICLILLLLLLSACAAKPPPAPPVLPEAVEAAEIPVPEPEAPEGPVEEAAAAPGESLQEDPDEISWEYWQLASYIRDALAVRQRETDVTLYFGPWETSRYENAPNLPENMYFVRVVAAFASGDTAAGSFYAAWDEATEVCDIFPADIYALLEGGRQFSFESGGIRDNPEAVVSLTADMQLPITPAYDPPAAEPVMPETTTYIPQSLVDAVIDAVHKYERPMDAFAPFVTGRELNEPPEEVELSEYVKSANCLAVDFDNDGVEDLFASVFFGGSAGLIYPYFYRGLPDGTYVKTYDGDDGNTSCSGTFIRWEDKNYWMSCLWSRISRSAHAPYLVFVVSFSDGWPQEALCLPLHPRETCIPSPDGDPENAQPCPPADRPIDPYIYTRWVNTDFPLPNL